jgi:hypothetical protein
MGLLRDAWRVLEFCLLGVGLSALFFSWYVFVCLIFWQLLISEPVSSKSGEVNSVNRGKFTEPRRMAVDPRARSKCERNCNISLWGVRHAI